MHLKSTRATTTVVLYRMAQKLTPVCFAVYIFNTPKIICMIFVN